MSKNSSGNCKDSPFPLFWYSTLFKRTLSPVTLANYFFSF